MCSLLNQTLINPVGQVYVYSDLSMITMEFIVGGLAKQFGYIQERDLSPSCSRGVTSEGGPCYPLSRVSPCFHWLHVPAGLSRLCYYEAFVRKYVFEANNMSDTGTC